MRSGKQIRQDSGLPLANLLKLFHDPSEEQEKII
jgi:hypothetical protein